MTVYNPTAIRAQLKTLLLTVAGVGTNVYDYMNPTPAGYPCIIFDITNEANILLDDSTNQHTITFSIYILAQISVAGEQTAKNLLDAVQQSAITILEKKSNDTLGSTVEWVYPPDGGRKHSPTPDGSAFMKDIQFKVMIASSIL